MGENVGSEAIYLKEYLEALIREFRKSEKSSQQAREKAHNAKEKDHKWKVATAQQVPGVADPKRAPDCY